MALKHVLGLPVYLLLPALALETRRCRAPTLCLIHTSSVTVHGDVLQTGQDSILSLVEQVKDSKGGEREGVRRGTARRCEVKHKCWRFGDDQGSMGKVC